MWYNFNGEKANAMTLLEEIQICENVALEFKRAKGSEMKAEKQRLKTAGYISLQVGKISHGDGQ